VVSRAAGGGGRDALAGAALARERLEEDDAALEAWVEAFWARVAGIEHGRDAVHVGVARWPGCARGGAAGAATAGCSRSGHGRLSRQGFEAFARGRRARDGTRFSLGARALR